MKFRLAITVFVSIVFLSCEFITAAPLSGTYFVGAGQTYTTLTKNNGFFGDVNSQGLSGNVTVYITSDLSEDGAKALTQWTETGAGGYTITILPSSNTLRTISMNGAKPIIIFDGADRVTFDGRFNGNGKYLLFRNSSGTSSVFLFRNDARRNTLTYCTIESNNADTLGTNGTIVFGTTTGTQGNDSNTISYCDIRDRSDATGYSVCAIFAQGTTTNANTFNDYNTITNCNIYNTYNATISSVDMYLADGNANWIITNNSFYQTAARSPSAASGHFGMIMATTGSNNIISGNYFGGSAPLCGGSAMDFNSGAGIFGFRIWQVGTTTPTVVQNNTVANIDYTITAAGDAFFFKGIETNVSGTCNITGNTIGSMSSTSSIILRYNAFLGNPLPAAINFGYYWNPGGSTFTGTVTNNSIGGITLTGSGSTAGNMTFTGIIAGFDQSLYNGSVTISGNTVGNNLASNFQNVLNVRTTFAGISTNVTSPGSVNVANNTIQNLTDGTTNSSAVLRGILHDGNGTFTATGNTISGLNTTSTNTGGITGGSTSNSVSGILTGSFSTGAVTISGNTIKGLRSNTAGATNTSAKGICIIGNSTGTINANKIYDITNASTGSGPAIYGFYDYGGTFTFTNNQIGLTNGELLDKKTGTIPVPGVNQPIQNNQSNIPSSNRNSTTGITAVERPMSIPRPVEEEKTTPRQPYEGDSFNGMIIQGIHDETSGTGNFYYNTVYVGGSATSGANLTSCYTRDVISHTANLKDNLFYNGRTGNGTHLAINNNVAGAGITGNYNVLISSNSSTIGRWVGTNGTIAAWRTSSGGDNQSWSTASGNLSASNLFVSVSTGDLRINTANTEAWIVSGKGIAIASVNSDFDGNARATTITGGCTDIGADEFAATPPNSPLATADFAPGSGVTSTYTLWGRTVCVINWSTGGSSYPSSVNVQYYSGVNPPNVLGGNYSNSYWSITPVGTLTGATYDAQIYIGDNETYTIAGPSTSTRLAKYNLTWEVFSATGTGVYQTELNWPNLNLKTRGLYNFSNFALTDVNSPLPVSIAYFNAAVDAREVKLNWATEWEVNNKGFNIERRNVLSDNSTTNWQTIGFVEGKGNSNTEQQYHFADDKLISGSYQYRLKQTDFNGNFEYFALNSPSTVTIGTPVSFSVFQNYPNPSNPNSKIDFQIPFTGRVSIKVYDVSGREAATLIDKEMTAGYYSAQFDGTNLSSGVYFYRVIATGNGQKYSDTKKMVLIK